MRMRSRDSRHCKLPGIRRNIMADPSKVAPSTTEVYPVTDVEVEVKYPAEAPQDPHRD